MSERLREFYQFAHQEPWLVFFGILVICQAVVQCVKYVTLMFNDADCSHCPHILKEDEDDE